MHYIFDILKIIFGGVFVLFFPGYVLSFFFLQKHEDILERIAISFALSIAIVPLIGFYLNLVGLKITALSIILEILVITGLATYFLYRKHILWWKK